MKKILGIFLALFSILFITSCDDSVYIPPYDLKGYWVKYFSHTIKRTPFLKFEVLGVTDDTFDYSSDSDSNGEVIKFIELKVVDYLNYDYIKYKHDVEIDSVYYYGIDMNKPYANELIHMFSSCDSFYMDYYAHLSLYKNLTSNKDIYMHACTLPYEKTLFFVKDEKIYYKEYEELLGLEKANRIVEDGQLEKDFLKYVSDFYKWALEYFNDEYFEYYPLSSKINQSNVYSSLYSYNKGNETFYLKDSNGNIITDKKYFLDLCSVCSSDKPLHYSELIYFPIEIKIDEEKFFENIKKTTFLYYKGNVEIKEFYNSTTLNPIYVKVSTPLNQEEVKTDESTLEELLNS
jgi:hypothetical protein